MTVKHMTSPYVQNLVVLATRGGDGEGSGGEGGEGRVVEPIDLSIIHHIGGGGGGGGGVRH